MRERIRTLLRRLDARLLGDGETFPIFRSEDRSIVTHRDMQSQAFEVVISNVIETGPPAFVEEQSRFRAVLFQASRDFDCDDCGRQTYWLDLQFRSPADEAWRPVLMLQESNLDVILSVLHAVERFLLEQSGSGRPRRLPRVSIGGKTYEVDARIGELRDIDNPHERVAFRGEE